MDIPRHCTRYVPPPCVFSSKSFDGVSIRHTFRIDGARDWLLIYTRGGGGLYRFPGGEHRSQPHELTLYRPGFFQDYQIDPKARRWDISYVHFLPRAEWVPWLHWPERSPGFMTLLLEPALRRRVARRFRDMVRLSASSGPRAQAFGQNAFEEILLWCDSINPHKTVPQSDPRIQRAIDLLRDHSTEPFSERKLTAAVGLSSSRMRELFQAQTGFSPRQFLEEHRLRRACDLLALTDQTIGEIAFELGFTNPFYFTLRFKKAVGESPRAYRNRIGSG